MDSDTPNALTFLEFGAINLKTNSKSIWDFRLHQEAYDFFMLARYMKDLMIFRKLAAGNDALEAGLATYQAGVFTKDLYNSFTKLAALHVCAADCAPTFVELGSTLMGCIDAMRYLQSIGGRCDPHFSDLDLRSVEWRGIDISQLLNDVAEAIYPSYPIKTYLSHQLFHDSTDVFFAKGVSLLYAFDSAAEFADYLARSQIAIFDYSFSISQQQSEILGTGKPVTYLSLPEVLQHSSSAGQLFFDRATLTVDHAKRRIRTLCYFGSDEHVTRVVAEETRLRDIVAARLSDESQRALLYYGAPGPISIASAAGILQGLEADR